VSLALLRYSLLQPIRESRVSSTHHLMARWHRRARCWPTNGYAQLRNLASTHALGLGPQLNYGMRPGYEAGNADVWRPWHSIGCPRCRYGALLLAINTTVCVLVATGWHVVVYVDMSRWLRMALAAWRCLKGHSPSGVVAVAGGHIWGVL
jgi:hypothetical protein